MTTKDQEKQPLRSTPGKSQRRQEPVEAYHLKIVLTGSKPAIWRRFVVPGETRLDRLHDVIQVVMGWTDSHLHLFDFGGRTFAEEPEEAWEGAEELAWVYKLFSIVLKPPVLWGIWYDLSPTMKQPCNTVFSGKYACFWHLSPYNL